MIASNEVCDVGNNLGTTGCAVGCGSITAGYSCSGEPSFCTMLCGNSVNNTNPPTYTELCDDGNTVSSDGCSSTC